MCELTNKKVAVLLAKLYDEREFWYPVIRLKEAGAAVTIVAIEADKEYKGKEGMVARPDTSFSQVKADDFDGVVIPGGFGPDSLRQSEECLEFVKTLHKQNKMIAFICHAGWVPISCGIVQDKTCTSVKAIKDDMVNAGCNWVDQALVVDGNFVTSRDPHDLPDFMQGVIGHLGKSGGRAHSHD